MPVTEPRLSPVAETDIPEKALTALEPYRNAEAGGEIYAIWTTLAAHPDALRRFLVFGNHVLGRNTLSVRARELVILRVAWLTQAEYEWLQHVRIARRAGVSDAGIRAVGTPVPTGFDETEQVLLLATDQLVGVADLDDDAWKRLRDRLGTEQLIDLVYTVGQYQTVAMAINAFRVQPEPDIAALRAELPLPAPTAAPTP
ncbi:carboxymuconolactone decarboxylase family protein [Streptomyces griseiscabiei]|uniref:Carboxymuconolactone decarboxylase family protein n=1 Tax=Streptomyces griseiscabiei TaxID=2993540 RepID=A0ABU4L371_9ACTN|nr:carboxymuconolactone decarboxylase family protein [Streptomyces griseiscabiei]MBZ3901540.1 carboxymuconolactone decarboxylase family protein [Streptomyces griseiscabiei]MDX2909910.1 carboxymuconolactone decarboxylase family protein [Streptomyces griseiscabiei]